MATQSKPMCLLLLGKTGFGKSSTGNSLLNDKIFKKSGNTTSETKTVKFGEATIGKYKLRVIDGPGLQDTDLNSVQDKETSITKMEEALALCCGGVDAFIVVIKYGDRFTYEDKSSIEALKSIIGDKFLSHVIVVMTCGNTFEYDKGDENYSFDDWCQKQKEGFKQLYEDCDGRVVLFENSERDEKKKEAQILSVVQLVEKINQNHGRYTHECFKKAETKREKMLLELEAPRLIPEYEIKIARLCLEIETFSKGAGYISEGDVRESMQELRREIEAKDKGHQVLNILLNMMDSMEEHLIDAVYVRKLHKKIGIARASNEVSSQLMTPLMQISAEVAKLNPHYGIGICAVSLAGTLLTKIGSTVGEMNLLEKLERRERIMKKRKNDMGKK